MDENLLLEQIEKEILSETPFPIFEVSPSRPDELKQIDKIFADIANTKEGSKERLNLLKMLSNEISKFTGVKKVTVKIKKRYTNAAVSPRYNDVFPELFKNSGKVKQEPSRYIKSFYVIIGKEIFDLFTNRELTAVMLHEIGHVVNHTSYLGLYLPKILKRLVVAGAMVGGTANVLTGFTMTKVMFPFLALAFAMSRSLTFAEHMDELNADDYAAKYGYADELAKAFNKFRKVGWADKEKQPTTWLAKTIRFFKSIFNLSTHPDTSDRICAMINKMKKDYKKQYPKLSKEISIIYADIRC